MSEQMLLNCTVLLACKLGKRVQVVIDDSLFVIEMALWGLKNRSSIKSSWCTVKQTWLPVVCICPVSAELPVLSLPGCSGGDGVVVGPGSGSELPVRTLLEQLAELWEGDCCSSAPLHLLFTPLAVTAVLKASDTEVRVPPLPWLIQQRLHL